MSFHNQLYLFLHKSIIYFPLQELDMQTVHFLQKPVQLLFLSTQCQTRSYFKHRQMLEQRIKSSQHQPPQHLVPSRVFSTHYNIFSYYIFSHYFLLYFLTHPLIHFTLILFYIFFFNSNMHHLFIQSTAIYFIPTLYRTLLQTLQIPQIKFLPSCTFWWTQIIVKNKL